MRKALLTYLRATIPDFDNCTDLVLADLGYAGSVQKALRRIFDLEGITTRIHGTYLLTYDDAFDSLAGDDTAEGFISDLIVTPHVKRMLIRNVSLLEQFCCSAEGFGARLSGRRGGARAEPAAGRTACPDERDPGRRRGVRRTRTRPAPQYDLQPLESLDGRGTLGHRHAGPAAAVARR